MRINYAFIGRVVLLAVMGLMLMIMETTVMLELQVFGAVPNLMLPAAVCVAAVYGEREGAVFGLCSGFVSDVLSGSPFLFSALFYMVTAYLIGALVKLYVSPGIITALVASTASVFVRQLFVIFYLLGTWGHLPIYSAFLSKLLPTFVYSVVLTPAVYGLVMLTYKISGAEGQRSSGFLK